MLYSLMSYDIHCHLDPDDLERYSRGRASETEAIQFEEHLLACEVCREGLENAESYARAMRSAAANFEEPPAKGFRWFAGTWSLPRLIPAFAALALIFWGVVRFTGNSQMPLAISLTATRGVGVGSAAPAGRTLAITPDLTGLAAGPSYHVEIVDERGKATWQGGYTPAAGALQVAAQHAGPHFVRIYSPGGELLREYGLMIGR
jgi:hypothetical protein